MQVTSDPAVVIEARDERGVVYRNTGGRRWRVDGECNRCGLCIIGAVPAERWVWDGLPGTPGAVRDLLYDTRLDDPVTPEFERHMRDMAQRTPTSTVAGCSLAFTVL